jgi:hypothetical protein
VRRDVVNVCDCPEEHDGRVTRHLLVHVHVVTRAGVVPGRQVFSRDVYDLLEIRVYWVLLKFGMGTLGV